MGLAQQEALEDSTEVRQGKENITDKEQGRLQSAVHFASTNVALCHTEGKDMNHRIDNSSEDYQGKGGRVNKANFKRSFLPRYYFLFKENFKEK
jgi:hypothetical protein